MVQMEGGLEGPHSVVATPRDSAVRLSGGQLGPITRAGQLHTCSLLCVDT